MKKESPRKPADIAAVIEARRERAITRQETWELVRRILLIAVVGYVLLTQVFLIDQVSGQHMFPAVKDGDVVLAYRLQRDYMRGDVVVCRVNGERHYGRIAAQAGDEIVIDEDGSVYINGQLPAEEILFPTYTQDLQPMRLEIPEGHVYLLGDYRTQTEDSRDFGVIPMADVDGKVITLLRRRAL